MLLICIQRGRTITQFRPRKAASALKKSPSCQKRRASRSGAVKNAYLINLSNFFSLSRAILPSVCASLADREGGGRLLLKWAVKNV